jgi:hypothetical protein
MMTVGQMESDWTKTPARVAAQTAMARRGSARYVTRHIDRAPASIKYSGQAVYGWVTVGRSLIGTTEGEVESR